MAVNLINSSDIEINQNGENIQLSTTVDMQTLQSQVNQNITNITNLQTYSKNEIATGEIWIDGREIYRKTYETTVNSNTTSTIDLSSLGYANIWVDYGKSFCIYSGNASSSSVNWYGSTSDYGFAAVTSSSVLNIKNNSAQQRTYYITLNYTKAS